VVEVLLSGLIALLIGIVAGPKFIEFLRRNELGQFIREEGPQGHRPKQGTPTMGGLLILIASAIPFLIFSEYTVEALTVLFVTLGCAAVGFTDDWMKLRHRRSLGLSGRWKLGLLAGITAVVGIVAERQDFKTSVYVPLADVDIPLSYGWYVLLFLMIAGTANGVNLTDGLDGLASGTAAFSLLTYTAMGIVAWLVSKRGGPEDMAQLDLAILGAALIGGTIGFLWYNAFPAEVFMGDTGSMALGGGIAAFAIMTKTEILLLLIGGVFLVEALSVMAQVVVFKWQGKRVFLMAPIHHHFEMKAWSETKIMVRFWILAAICCAAAFVLYYRYFSEFAS
jgi:phospho-N-acetylmuramoyl-pentapeptide-transferase